jgi:hypothetical protein
MSLAPDVLPLISTDSKSLDDADIPALSSFPVNGFNL